MEDLSLLPFLLVSLAQTHQSETQKAPFLETVRGFTCLFHLEVDMFYQLQVEVLFVWTAFIIEGCTVKWINGKKFKEVAKMMEGWESMTSEERPQEHAIYSLPEGIELPGAWEQTWVEEEEELFEMIMVVQQEVMTRS